MLLRLIPFIFVCLWATGFINARLAMPYSEPGTFLAIRFLAAFVVLGLIALMLKARWPGWRGAFHAILIGMLIHGLYLGAVFWAIDQGMPAGVSAVIVGLQPLLTALVAGAFLHEHIGRNHIAGLVLGLLGVAFVVAPKLDIASSGINTATVIAAFFGMVSVTLGTVYQKRIGGLSDIRTGTTLQYLGAVIPVGLFSLLFETRQVEWNGELIIALVWSVFVLSLIAVFLLMWLIREGSVAKVSTLFFLVPAVAAFMAWVGFDETLNSSQLFGMILCAVAVALATRSTAGPGHKDNSSPLAPAEPLSKTSN